MTREEAKREILFAKREVMADSWIDKAYDMAIKALEQQEIIRCEDCKHRDPENKKCDCGHGIIWQLPREDDWFCADAQPKASSSINIGMMLLM